MLKTEIVEHIKEYERGSTAFYATNRPSMPLDIFSCPLPPTSEKDELNMTDGESYNYNGQVIPSAALKIILNHPKLSPEGKEADVDSGRLSGMIFVSERDDLETLHLALCFNDYPHEIKVFSLDDVFGTLAFNGVHMVDSCCVAGDYLVYAITDNTAYGRKPWTTVFKTHLKTGKTYRVTPSGQADLSPSVSPSGKMIAVASSQRNDDWDGKIEDLKTDIYVMNVEEPLDRKFVVVNGGWPTWGSDDIIFFHRKVGEFWGVFRAEISKGHTSIPLRVTPDGVDAITPAAIDATTVAVATIRQKSQLDDIHVEEQYRHIEIFYSTGGRQPIQVTEKTRPTAHHFSPFVIDGGKRIGYHRCKSDPLKVLKNMEEQMRGTIVFFSTYRPAVPLDIFSCPVPWSSKNIYELHMTDGASYNYNGQVIPSAALKKILKRPKLALEGKEADVDLGHLSGMIFVSERNNLETLHIALQFNHGPPKVFSFADVFDTFNGVRMEDSGCVAGDYLVYVTTKDVAPNCRQPWTTVYRTNLITGKSDRITPPGQADLSPSVSPSGKMIAVASFERKGSWDGKMEDQKTDIFVMNVEEPFKRKLAVLNGGWPTWGSDSVIFFHRKVGEFWGVFRAEISKLGLTDSRVTPEGVDAITPAAIDATTVAVAIIRQKSQFNDVRVEAQYRHIEIFYSTGQKQPIQITQKTRPKADHFNPFVMDGGKRIGYHRCNSDVLMSGHEIPRQLDKLDSPLPGVGLFRVPGVFPTFSRDGSKLAFLDNEFKAVWVADNKGSSVVYSTKNDNVFSLAWNQNPDKDTLYICVGPSFHTKEALQICAIKNVSRGKRRRQILTRFASNAFPSTNPDGTKLVFRSTRGGNERYKNLYVMEDVQFGEYADSESIRSLTNGPWTDTHCQWSPRGDWIVFSSNRDKPKDAPETDNNLDPGYFAVFLVKWDDPSVVVRVVGSGNDLAGHVNFPFFSPDGKSIVVSADLAGVSVDPTALPFFFVSADLAAVSVDPTSLPFFLQSVRPYGEIFSIDIDTNDIKKNKDVKTFNRITHSRYKNSTAGWTIFSTQDPNAAWNLQHLDKKLHSDMPLCSS